MVRYVSIVISQSLKCAVVRIITSLIGHFVMSIQVLLGQCMEFDWFLLGK